MNNEEPYSLYMSKEPDDYIIESDNETAVEHAREIIQNPIVESLSFSIRPAKSKTEHNWTMPYESSYYDIPDGGEYAVIPAYIKVEDWLQVQNHVHNGSSWESFKLGAYEPTIESVAKDIEFGDVSEIPTPVFVIENGEKFDYAEGRSRGFGAQKGGLEYMPIWIAIS